MSLRLWDEQVVPRLTDVSQRGHEIGELREKTCGYLPGPSVSRPFTYLARGVAAS
ncbi:hypothetical protein [Nocardioides seonyuensis]|uniref:hypothetical protein n=1 Tax=Nocardioides seonyuensis TaxID=2518371 RepID=UPI0014202368|nr:hypothetical protein [Nocardioides seonyuensis]